MCRLFENSSAASFNSAIGGKTWPASALAPGAAAGWSAAVKFMGAVRFSNSVFESAEGGGKGS